MSNGQSGSTLESPAIDKLMGLLEEATRSNDVNVRRFIEPSERSLSRGTTRWHHIVFGRRGSGKSSLLRKVVADLTVSRTPIVMIDLEAFKGHEYPDVLLSVLIKTFERFEEWLRTAAINPATKTTFWQKIFGAAPTRGVLKKSEAARLANSLRANIIELRNQLHRAAAVERTEKRENETESKSDFKGSVKAKAEILEAELGSNSSSAVKATFATEEKFSTAKIDFLNRKVLDYQNVFTEISRLADGAAFLVLDDLYHIKRANQANLLDYFHRIAKSSGLYLKIGTIRHRSSWYVNGDPPTGLKIGDDMDDIDLDLTLEKYEIAKRFLIRIANQLIVEAGLSKIQDLTTEGGLNRLVLASGGVARDFLGIFRRAIMIAREQGITSDITSIGAEQVNAAAGEFESTKREEFKRDTLDEQQRLESQFDRLRAFCFDTAQSNIFLMEKDSRKQEYLDVQELVDLRFVHKVRSRVTVRSRVGKIFEAYMLDVSQYAAQRARRNFTMVEFWRTEESREQELRKASYIYVENESIA